MRRLLRRIGSRLRSARPQPLILMYHRVAAPMVDPWGLAVHPDRFAVHMEMLRKHRTPLPMSEVVRRTQDGTLPDNTVAVTFDDGYVDNVSDARPRLDATGVPATIFLVAGAIGQTREFWWDEMARGILGRREALDCEIPVNGDLRRLTFPAASGSNDDLQANKSWRAWQEPSTARQRTFLDFWRSLRDANAAARDEAMNRFREAANVPAADPTDLPMAPGDVAELVRDGLFEIGGHTLTHPPLPLLAPEERRREIEDGKRRCEQLAGREVRGFAYPHGALDDTCRAAVRAGGFTWACTTVAGSVQRSSDPHALPRLFVQDWDVATFAAALT
jgi:peptidoglycan/xylan/chitin deacetylase (PgdA/CDA1 family)